MTAREPPEDDDPGFSASGADPAAIDDGLDDGPQGLISDEIEDELAPPVEAPPPPAQAPPDEDGKVLQFMSVEEAKRLEALKRGPQAPSLAQWLALKLPAPDYLIGEVLCTTSRWLLYGDTGIGKTLFALMLAGAIAAGDQFLNWPATGHRRRVLYIDGEMPAQTMQERLKIMAAVYGEALDLWCFNRELADAESIRSPGTPGAVVGWPPFNDPKGVAWLRQVVENYRPDVVVFDSIMALVGGIMLEEESWAPMRPVVRWLSSRRCGQIWVHHSGHQGGHAYGTKTREWEMDTVLALRRPEKQEGLDEPDPQAPPDDDTIIEMEFTKARLRRPDNAAQFRTKTARFVSDDERAVWMVDDAATAQASRPPKQPRGKSGAAELIPLVVDAYDALCLDGQADLASDGTRRVAVATLRAWLMSHGKLDHDDGKLTNTARTWFARAKNALTDPKTGRFAEEKGEIWRAKGRPI